MMTLAGVVEAHELHTLEAHRKPRPIDAQADALRPWLVLAAHRCGRLAHRT
jgi:hypothetical protein